MDKNQAKKLLKTAVLIYSLSFLILNWNDISWAFNYRIVSGLVDDFFNPYPAIDASAMDAYFYPNRGQDENAKIIKDLKTNYTTKQNILEVPKLALEVPIIFSESNNKDNIVEDLNSGVVYYPGSVYPGQQGQIVILGHSAPLGWPQIKFDWAFSKINDLAEGDVILIHLNNREYTYLVKKKAIIEKGADVPLDNVKGNNELILVSCWPPGKDYQRVAVQAELKID